MWESLVRYTMMLLSQSYLFVCLLKHPTCFIYLFCAIASHRNLASNLRPPYGADIALLSYPHMVILLLYMAKRGEGRGGVHPTLNAKMYVMCAILFPPPPWFWNHCTHRINSHKPILYEDQDIFLTTHSATYLHKLHDVTHCMENPIF